MYTYNYPMTALTVDALVVAGSGARRAILLINRGKEPFRGMWALPGGFINMDETLEQACIRELYEETELALKSMRQFRTFDAVDRDPRQRTISVVYYDFISEEAEVTANDDAQTAGWFSLDNLPQLAFDHAEIIEQFKVEFLKN
ncbi:MAG: NUDIX hydrolase [Prolixibacteraceae bacterium]|nr:NUDIX hydrolase [Prolixibacteraceae bacterium]